MIFLNTVVYLQENGQFSAKNVFSSMKGKQNNHVDKLNSYKLMQHEYHQNSDDAGIGMPTIKRKTQKFVILKQVSKLVTGLQLPLLVTSL